MNSDSAGSVSMRNRCLKKAKASSEAAVAVPEASSKDDAGSEASFGENVLELEASRLVFSNPSKIWIWSPFFLVRHHLGGYRHCQ